VWRAGDAVVIRYVERWGPVAGLPVRVLEDSRERVVLHLAHGTDVHWPAIDGRTVRDWSLERRFTSTWEHRPTVWDRGRVVFVFPAGRAHGLWLFFDAAGRFDGRWYVNLQRPFVRTEIGVDTRDHTLDLWVDADGTHSWKDEDELEAAVRLGFYSPAEADGFRAEGERVLAEHPFPTGYESYAPDAGQPPPALPAGWEAVPSSLWPPEPGDESSRFRHESDDAPPPQRR
jgi:hypothetical protein